MGDQGARPEFTMGDRLRKAREHIGLTRAELAEKIGVHRQSVRNYETDQSQPRRPVLFAWSLVTGVDQTWLQTGKAGER